MNIEIENVDSTSSVRNNEIINLCLVATRGTNKLSIALCNISLALTDIEDFRFGSGASHIWVSNFKGERLILITEN